MENHGAKTKMLEDQKIEDREAKKIMKLIKSTEYFPPKYGKTVAKRYAKINKK